MCRCGGVTDSPTEMLHDRSVCECFVLYHMSVGGQYESVCVRARINPSPCDRQHTHTYWQNIQRWILRAHQSDCLRSGRSQSKKKYKMLTFPSRYRISLVWLFLIRLYRTPRISHEHSRLHACCACTRRIISVARRWCLFCIAVCFLPYGQPSTVSVSVCVCVRERKRLWDANAVSVDGWIEIVVINALCICVLCVLSMREIVLWWLVPSS